MLGSGCLRGSKRPALISAARGPDLLHRANAARSIPRMPFLRFREVMDQLEHVDDPQVLEKAKTSPALRRALELSRPMNWRGSDNRLAGRPGLGMNCSRG